MKYDQNIQCVFKILKCISIKDNLPLISRKILLSHLKHRYPIILATFWSRSGRSPSWMSLRDVIKSTVNTTVRRKGSVIKILQRVFIHPTHQTWHCVTSASSSKGKWSWKIDTWTDSGHSGRHESTDKDTDQKDFQNNVRKWQEQWDKRVWSRGGCFEQTFMQCVFYCNLNIDCDFGSHLILRKQAVGCKRVLLCLLLIGPYDHSKLCSRNKHCKM